jgi:hypothetical protein
MPAAPCFFCNYPIKILSRPHFDASGAREKQEHPAVVFRHGPGKVLSRGSQCWGAHIHAPNRSEQPVRRRHALGGSWQRPGQVFAVGEGELHDESIGPEGASLLVGGKFPKA